MDVVALLKLHEGFRSKPYPDVRGVMTIGYGQRLDELQVSESIATQLMFSRISLLTLKLHQFEWFPGLSEVRQAVLIDMAYQLGMLGLIDFVDLIDALGAGDFDQAREAMLASKWAKETPERAIQLANMMRANLWPS